MSLFFRDTSRDLPAIEREPPLEENPYSSPQAEGNHLIPSATAIGVWRLGNSVLMHEDAQLPRRCFRSNLPCEENERRLFSGNTPALLWTARIAFILVGFISAGAFLRFQIIPLAWYQACGAVILAIALAWVFAPPGTKAIYFTYYHSQWSRRRRRFWRIIGIMIVLVGLAQLPLAEKAFRPAWLPQEFTWVTILTIVCGAAIALPSSVGVSAVPFQGPYRLLSGCGWEFVNSLPECTLRFQPVLRRLLSIYVCLPDQSSH
jgi:hypothetical protein